MHALKRGFILAATVALLAAAAPSPPVLPQGQAVPAAKPYDEQQDAHKAVESAVALARSSGRLLLLDFGGNWCPDCRMLGGVLDLAPVRRWTDEHFVTVKIDVGRMTRNMDIAAAYGIKITAVPTVLVVTPDGRLLNGNDVFALANARRLSSQAVVDSLAAMTKG